MFKIFSLQNANFKKLMEEEKKEKNTGMAIVAYIIFFVPLLTDAKNDPFVKYHVKQGMVLAISGVVLSMVSVFIWFLGILGIGLFVLWIIGIMNASSGKKVPLPVIGQFAEKINI